MTIRIDLPQEVEAVFVQRAAAEGVTLEQLVRDCLLTNGASVEVNRMAAEQMDAVFEEIADMVPASTPPLGEESMSRESIYDREGEMP